MDKGTTKKINKDTFMKKKKKKKKKLYFHNKN